MKPVRAVSHVFVKLLVTFFIALALSACGGGGSSTPGSQDPEPEPVDVNGGGVKGPLINAILTVYLLDYSQPGFKGAVVDTGTTGADASIVGLSFVPTGGPYLFEFTSDPVGPPPTTDLTTGQPPVITTMRTVVVNDAGLSNLVYGTPLTTAAVDLAIANADSNVAPYAGNDDGTTTEEEFLSALEIAKGQILSTLGFGLDASVDIFTAPPIINENTTDEASLTLVAQYRTAIEAMTAIVDAMATSVGGTADDMLTAVVADMADDSEINGSPAGTEITATEITILEDPNPGALLIPNTSTPVNDVETILTDEQVGTGNDAIDPSPMLPVDPAPAEPVSDIDGDTFPDSTDNCPTVSNDQADFNSNGIGDACETISMPDLSGVNLASAQSTLAGLGFTNIVISRINDLSPIDQVISQAPVANSDVLILDEITLTVSDGVVVPNVIGMTEANATTAIETAGLVVNVNRVNDVAPIGQVIDQSPTSGNNLDPNAAITITVSDGVAVPSVVGQIEATATVNLEAAGFDVAVSRVNDVAPVGQVIGQNPAGGGNVESGATITITVSDGIVIPNVMGQVEAAATTVLETAGFNVDVNRVNDNSPIGQVIGQAPAGGGNASAGTTVTITVSDGVAVPSVVGQNEATATANLEAAGFDVAVIRVSDNAPIGQVIGQNPAGGGNAESGATITITVSDGVAVPFVVGLIEATATTNLETAGFAVAVNRVNDSSPIGQVIGQNPTGGSNASSGTTVTITVSDGVIIPPVVGQDESTATTNLEAAGFEVAVNRVSDNAPIGQVIAQNPAAGGNASSSSTVTITVSDGVNVPDVVGQAEATATTNLEAAGFTVTATPIAGAPPADVVVSQNPNGNTNANFGSDVTIFVSDGTVTGLPPADLSGIWKLQPTGSSIQDCLDANPGNARYLLTFPQLVQYISISQPGGGNAVTITYQNGIAASGSFNSDGSLVVSNGSRNWTDGHGNATGITYEFSGAFVAGTPDTLDLAIVDNTSSGSDSCSQTISYTAEFVYSPTGAENYNGTYITEGLDTSDLGPQIDRESRSWGVEINGSTATLTAVGDDGTVVQIDGAATFDTSTGLATITTDEVVPDDVDGDGFVDDIEHNQVTMYTLFVRSDSDTSGAPTMVNMWYETSLKYQDTAVLPAPGTTPFAVDNIFAQGYGRLAQAEGFTMSNHRPVNGGPGEEDLVTLGVVHPPLVGLDGFATNSFEIIEDASSLVRCSGTYATKYRIRETFPEHIPQADMALEEFLPTRYTFMNCHVDPANVIDNGAYTMEIRNSSGVLQHSIPITATPTTFATSITSRRQVNVNGALSSRTRRGDVIRLHGYFNSSLGNDLPVVVPVSTDPDIQNYRLRFSNPAFPAILAEFISTTNSFVIPGDSIFDSEDGANWDLTLIERYNRAGDRKAQSRSRKLRMQAGIRALVNSEIVHPVSGAVATAQFWLNGSNEFPNGTACMVTKPLDGTLICNSATINFDANTITAQVTFFGQPTTAEVTFTDSANATVVVFDPTGNWTGTARVVNPELSARSRINSSGNMRTDIVYTNPLAPASSGAAGGTGVLSSDSNQDLGLGAGVSLELWNNDYSTVYNSYIQTPLDGVSPQRNGAYLATNTGSVGLLASDSIRLVENGRTFRVDYGGDDPSSMLPPSRNQIFLNFGSGDVSASPFNFNNQTEIDSPLVSITWDHTPTALPADTLWQIRLREVLTAGDDHVPHSETRTVRLADGEGGLSFDPNVGTNGRWTWVVGPDFEIPSTGIWKFNLRVTNPENTIRGIGQGVIMVDQVANP